MEISLATKMDIPQLKNLWQACFFDDDFTINMFFDTCFLPCNTVVAKCEGEIVSAFYLIDAALIIDEKEYKSAYIYAAATLSDYRKKGIMSELLSFSEELCKKRNYDFQFLAPASDNLFDYYSKNGFKDGFFKKDIILNYNELESLNINEKCNFVRWNNDAIELSKKYQGINYKNSVNFMTIQKKDGIINSVLILNNSNSIENAKRYLLENFKSCDFRISVPADFSYNCKIERVGMIKPLKPFNKDFSNIYMGLTLA
ncbi:MAG: GNAT family N-acetyltransferase [Oscillospiraceae bacterium]